MASAILITCVVLAASTVLLVQAQPALPSLGGLGGWPSASHYYPGSIYGSSLAWPHPVAAPFAAPVAFPALGLGYGLGLGGLGLGLGFGRFPFKKSASSTKDKSIN